MTRVEFFTNVPNKHDATIALCEKALNKGRQLTILVENSEAVATLQQALWHSRPTAFLANATGRDPHAGFSPIILETDQAKMHQDDVLINLTLETPLVFSRFRYLAEMVGLDEADKALARVRYKFYRDRGYQIKTTEYTAE